jgi:peptidoglycan/xylan/chitin deacetylase (PgdA/CDA1 family)
MRLGGLSIDVDSVASHLEGYGFERPTDDGAAYRVAVPRIMNILDSFGARATFFLIAEEARYHPGVVRRIVARGHEVASHSMTHRLPFAQLTPSDLRLEVRGSKVLLEGLTGSRVAGFRAPSWDGNEALLSELAKAGYQYDSSTYPSILQPLLRIAVARRSVSERDHVQQISWRFVFGSTRPNVERLPYYHTLRLALPNVAFGVVRRLAHTRRKWVWYQLHAVDVLGLEEDGLNPRIARHPGMKWSLDRKLELLADEVRALGRCGDVIPLTELVDASFGARLEATDQPLVEHA